MIQAIIFDFFDVIRTDGFNRWLKKNGLKLEGLFVEAAEKNDRGEYQGKEFFVELARLSGQTPESVEQEMEHGNEFNRELLDYITTLRTSYRTAVLSNAPSAYIRNEIAMNDLDQYFDEIIVSSEVGYLKPQREIFELALSRLGVAAENTLFTDDNPRHVAGAQAAGLHTILFESTEQFRRDFEQLIAKDDAS